MALVRKPMPTKSECKESIWRKASIFERMVDWVNERFQIARGPADLPAFQFAKLMDDLSHPTQPPNPVILQFTPWDHLHGLGKHRLDFHGFNRGRGVIRLNHPADQKVLLLGHGLDGGPFGQQQFFGVEWVHG
jgi:hypothetical protein